VSVFDRCHGVIDSRLGVGGQDSSILPVITLNLTCTGWESWREMPLDILCGYPTSVVLFL
jgi:hypothetical protein